MSDVKVEYAVGLHLINEPTSIVHVPVVRLEQHQAALAAKDRELARARGELRKWRDGGRPEALEELRVQAAQTPPSNAAQTAYINGLVCELSTSKQVHADLLAKFDMLAKYVYTEDGVFGFEDGDTVDTAKGMVYSDLMKEAIKWCKWYAEERECYHGVTMMSKDDVAEDVNYQEAQAFLARPDVREWLERQKEGA